MGDVVAMDVDPKDEDIEDTIEKGVVKECAKADGVLKFLKLENLSMTRTRNVMFLCKHSMVPPEGRTAMSEGKFGSMDSSSGCRK
ncbi:hypothetical protein PanWU01x14_097070 [Parasponia andersonii]|uniref:Uncharacterized protein n=1 Tax=Parasponia andersonii TaxID=3476 RepID=A0A2P5D4D6_PARAD|nr:hypothetical protein PanWU01x14_097070 [Parasponia andersonii]